MAALLCASLFSALSPLVAAAPSPVEIHILSQDLLVIQSSYRIDGISVDDLTDRYHYFVGYRPDRRQATLLIRSRQDPLRLTVDAGFSETGVGTRRQFVVRNPVNYKARRISEKD